MITNSDRTERLREKLREATKQSKQTTLDRGLKLPRNEQAEAVDSERKKQIMITEIDIGAGEDELRLKVAFRLMPSKSAFSRLKAELFFNSQALKTLNLRVLQGALASDESEFRSVFDMKGIGAGVHVIKVEICEVWDSREKFGCNSREVAFDYVPVTREDRLIKIPIVKSVSGANLAVMSDSARDIYRDIREAEKKELYSKRDQK